MKSESAILNTVKLLAAKAGVRLWRNNVGCIIDKQTNLYIRFGLANESQEINSVFKSSDLIGIRPVTITPDMVGKTIGQFVAREVKKEGWRYRGDKREQAQKAFIELINLLGGDAAFTTGEDTF